MPERETLLQVLSAGAASLATGIPAFAAVTLEIR